MTSQADPRRLDVAAFARAGAESSGRWPVRGFPRLLESIVPEALQADAEIVWSARGEALAPPGRAGEFWLRLDISTVLPLECQRCLAPVTTPIEVDRRILFVEGEEAAALLDEEREEDVLALPRALDLHALVEEEVLLALPLVPRHVVCPAPLPNTAADLEAEDSPNPFGVLAELKRDRPLN